MDEVLGVRRVLVRNAKLVARHPPRVIVRHRSQLLDRIHGATRIVTSQEHLRRRAAAEELDILEVGVQDVGFELARAWRTHQHPFGLDRHVIHLERHRRRHVERVLPLKHANRCSTAALAAGRCA